MLNRKGQSTLEYAIVVAIIVGGLLAMQYYVKRGWEGKLKAAADGMGEQFEPAKYTAALTLTSNSASHQVEEGGATTSTLDGDSISTKSGNEALATWDTGTDVYQGQ